MSDPFHPAQHKVLGGSAAVPEVRFSSLAGERGTGDLFLPAVPSGKPPVLLIHGGGWKALSKEALLPIALLFRDLGREVFSINYRLLDQSPWPACADDCLAAANFLLDGGLREHGLRDPKRLLVCGASAGGHLAMMTGLRLSSGTVEGIVSLAGPSRIAALQDSDQSEFRSPEFLERFFGNATPSPQQLAEASPTQIVQKGAPPLTCIHSRNDRLVKPAHSEEAVAAWRGVGARAGMLTFDGKDAQHGFWDGSDLVSRRLVDPVDSLIREAEENLSTHSTTHRAP